MPRPRGVRILISNIEPLLEERALTIIFNAMMINDRETTQCLEVKQVKIEDTPTGEVIGTFTTVLIWALPGEPIRINDQLCHIKFLNRPNQPCSKCQFSLVWASLKTKFIIL